MTRPDELKRAHALAMAAKQTIFQALDALEREVVARQRGGFVDHRFAEMAAALQRGRYALEDFDNKRSDLQLAEDGRGRPVSRPRLRREGADE